MHNKVLIDYDEYVRLSKAAELCEELLKNKQGRGGYLSEIIAKKDTTDAVKPPLAREIGSITTPPNAIVKMPKNTFEKKVEKNSLPQTEHYIKDKWYFIGKP